MAATYAPRYNDGPMAEMNITPLVDVMLVMLVIFMIAAPALTHTLTTRLPHPSPNSVPPPARVELRVGANGDFTLDGHVLGADALRPALADIARRAPDTVLKVSAAADSEYQGFATALAAAQDSGLDDIALGD